MDRRTFLKALGAIGLSPAIPAPVLAAVSPTPAAVAVPASTYKWAEVIVRSHHKCNLSMLERLLNLDPATAGALKSQLIENGVISAARNQYGMHAAVKPLYKEVFPKPHKQTLNKLKSKVEELIEDESEVHGHESDRQNVDEALPAESPDNSEEVDNVSEVQDETGNMETDLEFTARKHP